MTFRQFTPSIYLWSYVYQGQLIKMKKAQHGRRQHIYSISHVWDGVLFVFSILFSLCVVYTFILTKQKVFHFLRIFARHWNLEWHKCVPHRIQLCLCVFVCLLRKKLLKRPTFCCVTTLRLWAWLTDWQLSLSSLCNLNYYVLDRVPILKWSHLTK